MVENVSTVEIPPYDPGRFSDLAGTPTAERLWAFLIREHNIIRMETASELGRAAVEAVASRLLDEFGPDIKEHRLKRMIGHMVKQVMRSRGFTPETSNVRVRVGGVFKRGTRYERLS